MEREEIERALPRLKRTKKPFGKRRRGLYRQDQILGLGTRVNAGVVALHPDFGFLEGSEAELRVEAVGVARGQGPAAQALQRGMRDDAFHKPFGEAAAAELLDYENIGDIGESRGVRDRAGEADLARAAGVSIPFIDALTSLVVLRARLAGAYPPLRSESSN